jgi:hypothetical protein
LNLTEVTKLLGYVAGACPAQKMNDFTGDAWLDILGHLEYAECRQAVRVVASKHPFISPSDIIAEVAAQRSPEQPHSNACRGGDCRDCRVSWCMCVCHPRAVQQLAGPPPFEPGPPALAAGPKRYEPGQLSIGRSVDDA